MTALSKPHRAMTDVTLRAVRALSAAQLQALLGISLRNGRGNCPLHKNSDSKSFVLYEMRDGHVGWKCHTVCGAGDALGLIARMNGLDSRTDFKKVVAIAGDLLGITNGASGGLSPADLDRLESEQQQRVEAKRAEQKECSLVLQFVAEHSALTGEPISYLRMRYGMTQFSEAMNLGFRSYEPDVFRQAFEHFGEEIATRHLGKVTDVNRDFLQRPLLLPVTDEAGDVVGIQGRSINPDCHKKWRFISRGYPSLGFFGGRDLAHNKSRLVVLCEGALDTLALRSANERLSPKWGDYITIGRAGVSGGLSSEQTEQLRGRRVLIAFDGDEAGKKGQESAVKSLHRVAKSVHLLPVPDGLDVSEWLEASK